MSDETKGLSFGQEEGQPTERDVDKKEDVAPQREDQPAGITRDEVQSLLDDQYRRVQSLVDKAEDRTVKRVQDRFTELDQERRKLEASGISISEERFAEMKEDEAMRIMGESGDVQDDAHLGDSAGDDEAYRQIVSNYTQHLYKEAGIVLEEDDPEAEDLDMSSPVTFMATLPTALAKKKQRLQDQGQTDPAKAAARSPAVGAAGGRADPLDGVKDPKELYKRYFERGR